MLAYINEVGTFVDTETLVTRPADDQGNVVMDDGAAVPLEDVCDEWWHALSDHNRHALNLLLVARRLAPSSKEVAA